MLSVWLMIASAGAQSVVNVGFRKDAPPFSSQSENENTIGDIRSKFSGFSADICNEIFSNTSVNIFIKEHGLGANERFSGIDGGAIDILCGPVSITTSRLEEYAFSLPFFLSGISYAIGPDVRLGSAERPIIVAMLRNTTAMGGLDAIELSGHFGSAGEKIYEEVQKFKNGSLTESDLSHVAFVDSYDQAFKGLCSRQFEYFIGDVDILTFHSKLYLRHNKCETLVARKNLTREIYGILFSRNFLKTNNVGLDLYLDFQSELFNFFQTGKIWKLFKKHFPKQKPSKELLAFISSFNRRVR